MANQINPRWGNKSLRKCSDRRLARKSTEQPTTPPLSALPLSIWALLPTTASKHLPEVTRESGKEWMVRSAVSKRFLSRDVKHPLPIVDSLEVLGENERDDRHQLHEDVEGRSRGVLERVTDGVTNDGRLKQNKTIRIRCKNRPTEGGRRYNSPLARVGKK